MMQRKVHGEDLPREIVVPVCCEDTHTFITQLLDVVVPAAVREGIQLVYPRFQHAQHCSRPLLEPRVQHVGGVLDPLPVGRLIEAELLKSADGLRSRLAAHIDERVSGIPPIPSTVNSGGGALLGHTQAVHFPAATSSRRESN